MKALKKFTNIDKALFLYQLFPDEISGLIKYIEETGEQFKTYTPEQIEAWEVGLLSFEFWISLIAQADRKIALYRNKLHNSRRLFACQLFDGQIAFYTIDCVCQYANQGQSLNPKFRMAVQLLFNR